MRTTNLEDGAGQASGAALLAEVHRLRGELNMALTARMVAESRLRNVERELARECIESSRLRDELGQARKWSQWRRRNWKTAHDALRDAWNQFAGKDGVKFDGGLSTLEVYRIQYDHRFAPTDPDRPVAVVR